MFTRIHDFHKGDEYKMKLFLCFWMSFLFFGFACNSSDGKVATQTQTPVQAAKQDPAKQDPAKSEKPKKNEGTPKVFLTLENKETGELKEVEADVELKAGEKFFVPSFNSAATASFQNVNLVDAEKKPVQIDLDRVYLIEYWSDEGLTRNQFWSQMRQLENEYKDSDEIKLLSINYNTAVMGKTQIENAQERLKQFSTPQNVLFDLDDSFRDSFPVIGPVMYILVDSRQQITFFGRGDNPQTQEVFDNVRDALLHLRSKKTGGITVVTQEEN